MIDAWRTRAQEVKRDTYAIWLCCRDPRVPWYVKALAAAILAYALSPVDLIPDFIPVLGYLDDIIIVPVGITLVRRMIPPEVLAEHRATATERLPSSLLGGAIIVTVWILALGLTAWAVFG